MRTQLITASAVVLLSAAGATANTRPAATLDDQQPAPAKAAATERPLTGTWRSAPDEMKLTTDFDKSVWGANATSVRTVELVVKSNSEATLRVVKRVLDAKRRTVPASTWIEEAQLRIGGATPGVADRLEHEVTVTSAVRLFPDDKDYRFTIDGLRVKIVTFTERDGNSLEVRYDTPEGRGSFWETLTRARSAPARAARASAETGS
jgi:hypothetical protein